MTNHSLSIAMPRYLDKFRTYTIYYCKINIVSTSPGLSSTQASDDLIISKTKTKIYRCPDYTIEQPSCLETNA